MESVVCNICEQDHSRLQVEVRDTNYGCSGTFRLVQCQQCGLVYQNPRPTPAEIGTYYPVAQYHPFRALWEGATVVPAPLHQQRARLLTEKIKAGKVLDVGCGSGLFLVAMQEQGWQCMGVEPNEAAAQFCRENLGLQVETGDIFSLTGSVAYELITFWDVLEHTHSPKIVLQQAHRLLKPAGYVALNVPNWDSLERRLFGENWIALDAPRHLYHFMPATLVKLLTLCGFTPQSMRDAAPPLSLASNVLRWAGDRFLRQGQAKALTGTPSITATPATISSSRRFLIALVHQAMKLPNAVANQLNKGAGITVIAQKREGGAKI
jgi:2-polyprenyl-3-methyl-5-hydroxy-6-metoxy-1,4-benzoquinol methylase